MSLIFPVSLVIPILNEALSLKDLLPALKNQSHRPDEIIFCDAGSNDGSRDLITSWWQDEKWENAECTVILRPGAMPGAGRNAGIDIARNSWIAFIDGGIVPANDWLEQLCRHASNTQSRAVFGICHFSGESNVSRAVCALSYGQGSFHPVIPASLFSIKVFHDIGGFAANLRAGEDLLWLEKFKRRYGDQDICVNARVNYTHFPTDWRSTFKKWRVTEMNCVIAGVRMRQHFAYFLGLPAIYISPIFGGSVGLSIFLIYLSYRGVIEPVRRSLDRPWWRHKQLAGLVAPLIACVIDIAKWVGILQGAIIRLSDYIYSRKNQTC